MKRVIKLLILVFALMSVFTVLFLASPIFGVYYREPEEQKEVEVIESNLDDTSKLIPERKSTYQVIDIETEKINFLRVYESVAGDEVIDNSNRIKTLELVEEEPKKLNIEVPSKDIKEQTIEESSMEYVQPSEEIISVNDENQNIIVSSENILDSLPSCEEVGMEMQNRPNMIGRFIVPSQGINVAVFNSLSQAVCDNYDSAAYGFQNNNYILADHKHQAFSTLYYCYLGTMAYWVTDTEIIEYVSEGVFAGHNTGVSIVDTAYNLWPDVDGFVAYTCKEHWKNIAIVPFVRK